MDFPQKFRGVFELALLSDNDRHVRGYSETTCPPLPPEDGRFDPTSPTSINSS